MPHPDFEPIGPIKGSNEPDAIVSLDFSLFPFARRLEVGEKGIMEVDGIIVRERVDEEDDSVIKTVKISKANMKKENARL